MFDGLLPEPHNKCVLQLLFDLAHWHGLAKLRMHTDQTLDVLSRATTSLGSSLRCFEETTCAVFETRELERERAARQRRQVKCPTRTTSESTLPATHARKKKQLNLRTYKYHALGDYVDTIRRLGTTDSYSTQSVSFCVELCDIAHLRGHQSELEHRRSKARALRTSGRSIPQQLSKIERRQRHIGMVRARLDRQQHGSPSEIESEDIAHDPGVQYNMGKSQKCTIHLPTFLQKNAGDPAIKVNSCALFPQSVLIPPLQNFFPKLREHLFHRIQALQEGGPSESNLGMALLTGSTHGTQGNPCNFVFFKNDCIYQHKLIRFHYTTYDVRRGTDIVNPGTSRHNIMLLADNAECSGDSSHSHDFLYARVLGAYHANVMYAGPGMQNFEPCRFDFLWVRWFEVVNPASSGWSSSRLDLVHFPPMHENDSFGFVDPKDVLRGCHIIPAYAKGKRHENAINLSRCANDGKDYNQYYIGRCVDCFLI